VGAGAVTSVTGMTNSLGDLVEEVRRVMDEQAKERVLEA
jgi:hypothetical protein